MATDPTKIAAVIAEKTQKGLPFTAWSITTELRKQNVPGSHDDVKNEVHRLFKAGQMQNYLRESMPIPGRTNKCWVYYPPALDPKIMGATENQAFLDYLFNNGPEISANAPMSAAAAASLAAALPPGTVGVALTGQVVASSNPDPDEDDEDDDNGPL